MKFRHCWTAPGKIHCCYPPPLTKFFRRPCAEALLGEETAQCRVSLAGRNRPGHVAALSSAILAIPHEAEFRGKRKTSQTRNSAVGGFLPTPKNNRGRLRCGSSSDDVTVTARFRDFQLGLKKQRRRGTLRISRQGSLARIRRGGGEIEIGAVQKIPAPSQPNRCQMLVFAVGAGPFRRW